MVNWPLFIAIWIAVAIPASLLAARFIKHGRGPEELQ